jgi:hypothetical protein
MLAGVVFWLPRGSRSYAGAMQELICAAVDARNVAGVLYLGPPGAQMITGVIFARLQDPNGSRGYAGAYLRGPWVLET